MNTSKLANEWATGAGQIVFGIRPSAVLGDLATDRGLWCIRM